MPCYRCSLEVTGKDGSQKRLNIGWFKSNDLSRSSILATVADRRLQNLTVTADHGTIPSNNMLLSQDIHGFAAINRAISSDFVCPSIGQSSNEWTRLRLSGYENSSSCIVLSGAKVCINTQLAQISSAVKSRNPELLHQSFTDSRAIYSRNQNFLANFAANEYRKWTLSTPAHNTLQHSLVIPHLRTSEIGKVSHDSPMLQELGRICYSRYLQPLRSDVGRANHEGYLHKVGRMTLCMVDDDQVDFDDDGVEITTQAFSTQQCRLIQRATADHDTRCLIYLSEQQIIPIVPDMQSQTDLSDSLAAMLKNWFRWMSKNDEEDRGRCVLLLCSGDPVFRMTARCSDLLLEWRLPHCKTISGAAVHRTVCS